MPDSAEPLRFLEKQLDRQADEINEVRDDVKGLRDREAERDQREVERDVKVDIAIGAMNRLAVIVGGVGSTVVATAIIWLILKGGQ